MYDTKCRELAEAFLADEPEHRRTPAHTIALAQHIQDAIEGYLEDARRADHGEDDL